MPFSVEGCHSASILPDAPCILSLSPHRHKLALKHWPRLVEAEYILDSQPCGCPIQSQHWCLPDATAEACSCISTLPAHLHKLAHDQDPRVVDADDDLDWHMRQRRQDAHDTHRTPITLSRVRSCTACPGCHIEHSRQTIVGLVDSGEGLRSGGGQQQGGQHQHQVSDRK